jgi:c-di-GMP phosphodiesterase
VLHPVSKSILDCVALGYQPVWDAQRHLAAVRLQVLTVLPEGVDAAHLLKVLDSDWPAAAPLLILSLDTPDLVRQVLEEEPVQNSWLEVPAALFETPEDMARLGAAAARGHQLLRQADLADVRHEVLTPLDTRSLLRLSAGDALLALQHRARGGPAGAGPLKADQIYAGVADRNLAAYCLDEAGAWGLLGWPDDDVLHARREKPLACAAEVIAQIRQAIEEECSLEHLERLVRQDPVLVYRLLSLVNSSAFGGKQREIDSLRHALMMLGFTSLTRWLDEQDPISDQDINLHPVRYAMVMRSRLAQHLLEAGSEDDLRAEVFTAALFAQLDRLLHQPLSTLLGKLPMSGRVFDAVLRQTGPYHPLLELADMQGDPQRLNRLPEHCEEHQIGLEQANRSLLRMLATSRDYTGKRSQRLL